MSGLNLNMPSSIVATRETENGLGTWGQSKIPQRVMRHLGMSQEQQRAYL